MDELYAAAYRWQNGAWHTLAAPALLPLQHANDLVPVPGMLAVAAHFPVFTAPRGTYPGTSRENG